MRLHCRISDPLPELTNFIRGVEKDELFCRRLGYSVLITVGSVAVIISMHLHVRMVYYKST